MQYGLIPEFIGRLPVTSAVHQLSRDDLITILTEPRNAIVKQFQRFFGFDGIELVFSDDALKAVADKALERETGARGLRSIIEEILLEVQFELPSRRDVKKCVVTKETVERGVKPTLVTEAPDEGDEGPPPSPPEWPRGCSATRSGAASGRVTRTRAVLEATGFDGAVALLAAPAAAPLGRRAGAALTPAYDDAADPPALARWIARQIADCEADALLVDALPGGVMGELCGLAALDGLELRHTARLLRWAAYARRLEGPLPRYDAAHVVEPLHPGHERALAGLAGAVSRRSSCPRRRPPARRPGRAPRGSSSTPARRARCARSPGSPTSAAAGRRCT